AGVQAHGPLAEGGVVDGFGAAVDDAEVAAGAAPGTFAQGAGGDQAAVAVAAAAVDDLDLDVAAQAVVLEAVVADDDVAAGFDQGACGGEAVAVDAHPGAGAVGDEDGFVAAVAGVGAGFDPQGALGVFAAIAAAGDAGGPAGGAQAFDHGDGERGLAAAAGDEVADDDDRGFGAAAAAQALAVEPLAGPDGAIVEAGQQACGKGDAGAVEPPGRRLAAHGSGASRNCIWWRWAKRPARARGSAWVPGSTRRPSASTSNWQACSMVDSRRALTRVVGS